MTPTHLDASEFYALAVEYATENDLDVEETGSEWLDAWTEGHTASIPTKVDALLMRVARSETKTSQLREMFEVLARVTVVVL